MKTSLWTIAAATLLLAGCSKEEITENVTEGVSSVATPTNGNARSSNPDNLPDVWFNKNNGRMNVRLKGNDNPSSLNVFVEDDEASEGTLNRQGNSKNYRTTNDFIDAQSMYFSLVDVTLTSPHFIDDWQGETAYMKLFVYPSGRTVGQAPIVAKTGLVGLWNFDDSHAQDNSRLSVVVADDPAQELATIKFVSAPVFEDPTDPTSSTEGETIILEKTHENQNLGVSHWAWTGGSWEGTGTTLGSLYLNSANKYDVDFLAGETNAQIIGKYNVTADGNGQASSVLSDDPEILGTRIESTTFGETWKMELAFADLGDWVESVNFVIDEVDGSDVEDLQLQLKLERTEGNLRIYSYSGVISKLNPDGGDLAGAVYFSKGVRKKKLLEKARYIHALRNEEL